MTRVDFYILQDVDLAAAHRFACRLAAKAITTGTAVHIHADDQRAAAELDEMLWHYPEHRFIPHACEASTLAPSSPLRLGWSQPANPDGVLINLASEIPNFFGRFDRVAEIVVEATRDLGRDRYKFYRDRGYPLFHHELEDWETA
jgi:DNA polymerase-3 subunit chi